MKLYYVILSPYAQKALLAFYEKGVEFAPVKVDFSSDEGRAAYREIYPMGKVPLLVTEDSFIPESSIIVEYLEDEFAGSGTQLIPTEKTAARKVRFKDRMIDLYVNDPVGTIFFDGRKPIDKQNPEAVAKARDTLTKSFGYLNKDLETKPFIAGDTFSMADCALFGPLFYAQKVQPFGEYEHLTSYFQRMMQRPSVQKLLVELLPVLQRMNN